MHIAFAECLKGIGQFFREHLRHRYMRFVRASSEYPKEISNGSLELASVKLLQGWLRLLGQISLLDKWICLGG
jgi:hypothetical protein